MLFSQIPYETSFIVCTLSRAFSFYVNAEKSCFCTYQYLLIQVALICYTHIDTYFQVILKFRIH